MTVTKDQAQMLATLACATEGYGLHILNAAAQSLCHDSQTYGQEHDLTEARFRARHMLRAMAEWLEEQP